MCLLAACLHDGRGGNFGFQVSLHTLRCIFWVADLLPALLCTLDREVCWQPWHEALAAMLGEIMIAGGLECVFLVPSVEPGMLHLLAHLELVACR